VESVTHRDYAYSVKGEKIRSEISGKRHSRTSIISGLNQDNQFIAPMVFTGSGNTNVVLTWVKEVLLPCLTETSVIIFDNASFHKSTKICQAIESAGHIILFLPPYSPDLNPIEHLWKALKQNLNYYYDIQRSFFQNLCLQINLLSTPL
jgi:transposase